MNTATDLIAETSNAPACVAHVVVAAVGTPGRTTRRWTADEELFVRENYQAMTCKQMAVALRRTQSQVRNRCWKFGYEFQHAIHQRAWSHGEIALLRAVYKTSEFDCEIGLDALAKQLDRNKANICRKARELGLTQQGRKSILPADLRPERLPKFATHAERCANQSRLILERLAEKGHPRGALGMKHSEEAKERIGIKSKERWASMSDEDRANQIYAQQSARRSNAQIPARSRGSWKAGWREVGLQRCYFRSRWEANYARYLEWLRGIGEIASWEHEAHVFWFEGIKRGCVSYLPDFKVTNPNGSVEWHEVKGWMDARSKTTLARMAKYHPNEKLVVIREKQYKEIGRKVSSLVHGWESDAKPSHVRITVQADA